ncbi:MAG: phosphonate C-P lyase system protein PhnH [Pseudomonadota bacterium]
MADDQSTIVSGGFADPVHAAQRTFTTVMQALARPGSIMAMPDLAAAAPEPVYPTTAALLLTLTDADSPVWFDQACDSDAMRGWIAFHTGAPVTDDHGAAMFAVISNPAKLPPLMMFALGSQEYPDRSTTLFVQVEGFGHGQRLHLEGPGIDGMGDLEIAGLPDEFAERLAENATLYPRGVDLVLVSDTAIVGLPRTTRLQRMETV